jgi:alanyl-tRNA synthetase
VPSTDPTLLFTNAGMVQFKDWFADTELASSRRVVTVQRCMRAGGKHNDLDNVGQTARHHTLFEMLGNFAFSDAADAVRIAAASASGEPSPLKTEAITSAWHFLTEVVRLPPEKLMVTVHEDDAEAEHIWRNIVGLPAEQVTHGGEDNWWSMGAGAGPVGPCTEIFWDQEQEVDGERWLELWNLVFMEHLRDEQGGLSPLPRPCVDTGMGLERIASVLQGVPSNYHTDGFDPIFNALAELTGLDDANWRGGRDEQSVAARVIADHLRAVCFLLCDGVVPSNVGRGYTFRRVLTVTDAFSEY